ncbi:hypothetical protein Hanom_Chr05g00419351 [Helianthus anomalus]
MFWKSARYDESTKTIHSAVQKKDEKGKYIDVEVKFNVGDLRRVLELGDSDNDPTIVPERLCKGLWFRMGFEGHVNGKYLKSLFCRPYKFLVHCVVHASSHRKGAYDETSDYIMNIITCLVLNRPYNVSQAVQSGVIPRNVRAKKSGATMPETQSGKNEKHVSTSKGTEAVIDQNIEVPKVPEVQGVEKPEVVKEKALESSEHVKKGADDAESFPNIQDLKKKTSLLEKEKEKAEAERDKLKKQLEELSKVNEEIKSVIIKHAKKIKNMKGDVDDNAKLFELLSVEISDLHMKNKKLNEINQTLN